MDRARLTILAVCALLTTTIEPFSGDERASAPSTSNVVAALPAVSSNRTRPVESNPARNEHPVNKVDEELISHILERLSIRHTALSESERMALVLTIIREARAHDLEPGLVVAVIEVESAGYHLATSHVGAMGLMQLLPSTGKELAARMNIEWKGDDTLFDPTINVRLGTAYLRQLADRFGNVNTALAAYNWGPGRIDRRLRRGATLPSRYIEQVRRAVDRNQTISLGRS
jgi:soluble lytic murein transglycosylase-like protein